MPIILAFFLCIMDEIITGISLGFFLSFMIGPVFFILIETSLTKGFRAALALDLGVIVADLSFIRLQKLKRTEIHIETKEYRNNYFTLFGKGFLLNFINVGVLGFWLAIIITIGPQLEMHAEKLLKFFSYVLLAYFVTDIFKIL